MWNSKALGRTCHFLRFTNVIRQPHAQFLRPTTRHWLYCQLSAMTMLWSSMNIQAVNRALKGLPLCLVGGKFRRWDRLKVETLPLAVVFDHSYKLVDISRESKLYHESVSQNLPAFTSLCAIEINGINIRKDKSNAPNKLPTLEILNLGRNFPAT